jgi:hypothetical protein
MNVDHDAGDPQPWVRAYQGDEVEEVGNGTPIAPAPNAASLVPPKSKKIRPQDVTLVTVDIATFKRVVNINLETLWQCLLKAEKELGCIQHSPETLMIKFAYWLGRRGLTPCGKRYIKELGKDVIKKYDFWKDKPMSKPQMYHYLDALERFQLVLPTGGKSAVNGFTQRKALGWVVLRQDKNMSVASSVVVSELIADLGKDARIQSALPTSLLTGRDLKAKVEHQRLGRQRVRAEKLAAKKLEQDQFVAYEADEVVNSDD